MCLSMITIWSAKKCTISKVSPFAIIPSWGLNIPVQIRLENHWKWSQVRCLLLYWQWQISNMSMTIVMGSKDSLHNLWNSTRLAICYICRWSHNYLLNINAPLPLLVCFCTDADEAVQAGSLITLKHKRPKEASATSTSANIKWQASRRTRWKCKTKHVWFTKCF